jgi:hypothetical protein
MTHVNVKFRNTSGNERADMPLDQGLATNLDEGLRQPPGQWQQASALAGRKQNRFQALLPSLALRC